MVSVTRDTAGLGVAVVVDALRYALTLAEELHFGRSAARHYISEAQFGRRIRQLESELGTRVFDRTSRRVQVTPEGARVMAQARRVLDELDILRHDARQGRHADAETTIRVGVLGFGIGDRWPTLRDLVVSACPGVELTHRALTLADQYVALLRREVDVALVHFLGDVDGLDLQFVMETPRVAVVPLASPVARTDHLGVEDLEAHRWLRLIGYDDRFEEWVGARPAIGPAVTSLETLTAAVATTGHFGVHGAVASKFYARPDVCFVPLDGAPVATAVATRRDDDRPVVQAFRAAAAYLATPAA